MDVVFLILLIFILLEVTFLIFRDRFTSKLSGARKIYVDTSALIDGRIIEIARAGFLPGPLVIPRSVTRELQTLADSKDHFKRESARTGLSNIHELERVENCNVEILQDELDNTGVDERLLELAKSNRGCILTTDYNLCQIAKTEHIEAINPNRLSSTLSTNLPVGTTFDIKITATGTERYQGVGYLGSTMVVVSRASKFLNQTIRVVVRQTISTDSGRIIFATVDQPFTHPSGRKNSK